MKYFVHFFHFSILFALVISGCASIETQTPLVSTPFAYTPTAFPAETLSDQGALSATQSQEVSIANLPDETPAASLAVSELTGLASATTSVYGMPELVHCVQDGCIYSVFQPLLRPLPAEFDPVVEKTYRYGSTQNGTREAHAGVEFPSATGTPVLAASEGVVFFAGDDHSIAFGPIKNFYGNLVILEHHWDGLEIPVYTVYAHLSQIFVKTGSEVAAGQKIGEVGITGTSSGSHLHFEVRVNSPDAGNMVNPELWLTPAQIEIDDKTEQSCGTLVARFSKGDDTVPSVAVLLEDFSDPQAERKPYIDAESYARGVSNDSFWKENLVIGDLSPGAYRISLVRDNQVYQKFINIEPERITLVEFEFVN